MATMMGRFVKPIRMGFGIHNKLTNNLSIRAPIAAQLSIKQMSTTSNYHYHEKPPKHTHEKLWKAERYLSLALLGVIPAAAVIPHPILDYGLALSLVVHVHWGVEAIVTDYIRPSIFGPTIPKISIALVYVLSSLALGGLFMFNYTDVGITQATRMLSKI